MYLDIYSLSHARQLDTRPPSALHLLLLPQANVNEILEISVGELFFRPQNVFAIGRWKRWSPDSVERANA